MHTEEHTHTHHTHHNTTNDGSLLLVLTVPLSKETESEVFDKTEVEEDEEGRSEWMCCAIAPRLS